MAKVIRLNESELVNLIKNIITESLEKTINNRDITSTIKNKLGVKDLTSGKFKLKYGTNSGGIIIFHPDYDKNKKSTLIQLKDKLGIPDSGTWSINGTYLTLKKWNIP